ncbi:hypothetical protein M413DRAFT_66200, partial [Hebeloma cylindrosporum]
NLVVPKAVIEIPETAALPSLPQTGHAALTTKKGKPLVPSNTLTTPCNLYMQDFVKEYPDAGKDEFRAAFAKLDSKRRHVRTLHSSSQAFTDILGTLGL